MTSMTSIYFMALIAIIGFLACVHSFPMEMTEEPQNNNNFGLIPRHNKRSIYGIYRYIPKMTENKIKKDYDDPFESRSYGRFYFTE